MSSFACRNKDFWNNQLGGGIDNVQKARSNWQDYNQNAQQAWDAQYGTKHGQTDQKKHPREEFQDNMIKQAQGLWNMLQGKGKSIWFQIYDYLHLVRCELLLATSLGTSLRCEIKK